MKLYFIRRKEPLTAPKLVYMLYLHVYWTGGETEMSDGSSSCWSCLSSLWNSPLPLKEGFPLKARRYHTSQTLQNTKAVHKCMWSFIFRGRFSPVINKESRFTDLERTSCGLSGFENKVSSVIKCILMLVSAWSSIMLAFLHLLSACSVSIRLTCWSVCVFQIRVDGIPPPAQNALLYETVTVVEGKPILRDMVFSPDHQYIYLLSDRQVKHTHTVSSVSLLSLCLWSPSKHSDDLMEALH